MASVGATRGVLGATSATAFLALGGQYYLSVTGGEYGFLEETFRYFGFFTILSNIMVAVTTLLLAIDPTRRGPWLSAARLASLYMISITGVVYHLVLAGDNNPQGLGWWTNLGTHTVVPIVAVLGWVLVGPRGMFHWDTLLRSLVFPVAWLAYALTRDAVLSEPTYPFMDVPGLGVPQVALNLGVIILVGLLLGAAKVGLDRALHRRRPAPVEADDQVRVEA